MAYDPKTYLEKALKSGFQDIYSSASNIDDSPRYEGSEARFGNVVVRPLMELIGASEQDIGSSQQTGHAVSVPLSGKYEGYFRNDIYDNQGNFVKTTYTEPDKDPYGLKDLAQLGLTAASFGALGPTGKLISQGVSGFNALKSGDPLRILSAAANIPGAEGVIPADLKSIANYVGKAGQVKSALSGDPNAIFGLITGAAKSGALPDGKAASAGYGGADPGYFDPDAETAPLPDWALDPYGTQSEFLPASEVIRERQSLEDRYPAPEGQSGYNVAPKTSMSPQDMSRFLEANIDDPGSIEMLMQEYYPELYRQQIGVTGTLPKAEEPGFTPGRSIRDVGTVTQVQPGEPLEGTEIKEPDLSVGIPTATAPAGKPGAPKSPATLSKPSTPGFDPSSLLAFFNTQKPAEEPYRVAQTVASPFGTIYDTYGGNDMQDLLGFLRRG